MMKKLIYPTFFILLLFGCGESYAQGYLKAEHLTSSELKDELGNHYGNGSMQVVSGAYIMPVSSKRLDNGQVRALSASLSASFAKMENEGKALEMNPDDIINANLSLSYLQPFNRKWRMMAILGAGLYSSSNEITSSSILANGGVVFIVRVNDNIDLGFGAGVTNSYGTPMAMPMLYLSWHPRWKMKFQIDLTNSLKGTTVRDSVLKPACISSNFAVKIELWTKWNYTGRFSHPSVPSVPKGDSLRHSIPTVRLME